MARQRSFLPAHTEQEDAIMKMISEDLSMLRERIEKELGWGHAFDQMVSRMDGSLFDDLRNVALDFTESLKTELLGHLPPPGQQYTGDSIHDAGRRASSAVANTSGRVVATDALLFLGLLVDALASRSKANPITKEDRPGEGRPKSTRAPG